MKKVVILEIEDYNLLILKEKISKAIKEHFSGEKKFLAADKILLKPNLLSISSPEEAITTHPVFLEAVGMIFKDLGCRVFMADSSGGFASDKDTDYVYQALGLKEIATRCGFELLYPTHTVVREGFPFCWWADSLASGAEDGFKMINLPKLKTHTIMVLTLAVKNLYGCISGAYKSQLHRLNPRTEDLAKVILKLYKNIKPALNIVDGILALEGEGPAQKGKPKKISIVVIGDDALYVDYAIGRFLGLADNAHPLIKAAKSDGLLEEKELTLISEVKGKCVNFKLPAPFILNCLPKAILPLGRRLLKFRPRINKEKCTGCLKCRQICPNQAIEIKKGKAFIDYQKCIMCMCCAEVCRYCAVDLEKSLLLKAVSKFS